MRRIFISLILICMFVNMLLSEDEALPKITTVKEIIDNISEKFDKIRTFTSRFHIKTVSEGIEKESYGEIKYRKPDTFIMLFDNPKDQIIYTDGKVLKIYVPELNVVGEQKLESQYRSTFFISDRTSLYYLRSKYQFSFFDSNKPVMIGDSPYYILLLEPRERVSEFKRIKLWVSKYWLIVKAEAETISGNTVSISFSKINLNRKLTDNEFEFNLPVNTQTIINPLLFDTGKE